MAAHDYGDELQAEFERKREQILEYFLSELLDLYAYYDEIEPGETLVCSVDIVPDESINESFGFSDN